MQLKIFRKGYIIMNNIKYIITFNRYFDSYCSFYIFIRVPYIIFIFKLEAPVA